MIFYKDIIILDFTNQYIVCQHAAEVNEVANHVGVVKHFGDYPIKE